MIWLVLGVLVFAAIHILPAFPGARRRAVERYGEHRYKGLFSLAVLAGITLIAIGWRASPPRYLYAPPSGAATVALALNFVATVLVVAAYLPSNLKRAVRNPQLAGALVWAGAHLLANGDSRSLALFGGIGLWAILEIRLLNRRDGAWQRPAPLPLGAELKVIGAAVAAFAALYLIHPFITGVSPLPR